MHHAWVCFFWYGAGSLYSTIKKWHLNIFRHLKKSRYRKNKPITLFSKTCSIELPASFLIYTLLKKLLAFKIALFLYDRPIFVTIKYEHGYKRKFFKNQANQKIIIR